MHGDSLAREMGSLLSRIAESDLERYRSLRALLHHTDVSRDAAYQTKFIGFYKLQKLTSQFRDQLSLSETQSG